MTHSSSLVTRCCSIEPRTRKNLSKDMDFYYFPKSIQQTFKTINHPRTRKYVNGYGFLSLARNLCSKYGKQLLDTRLDALKIGCKRS